MNTANINILINNVTSVNAIDSIRKQKDKNIKCFLINNHIKNIDDYIGDDDRFCVSEQNMRDVIGQIKNGYVLFMDCDDALSAQATENIARIIYLAAPDVIHFKPNSQIVQRDFSYIFQHDKIINYVFCDINTFCIKIDVIKKSVMDDLPHLWLIDILNKSNDFVLTNNIYTIAKDKKIINDSHDYKKIVNCFLNNQKSYGKTFWGKYFATLIPNIIRDTVKNNDQNTFVYCAKNIPIGFVPLKYKPLFFIIKTFNK